MSLELDFWECFPVFAHLPHQSGISGIGDVVLPDVPVDPVAEVQESVVQGDQDVRDESFGKELRS